MKPLHEQSFAPTVLLIAGIACRIFVAIQGERREHPLPSSTVETADAIAIFAIVLAVTWLVFGWICRRFSAAWPKVKAALKELKERD